MKAERISRLIRFSWLTALNVGFIILCLRFIGAAMKAIQPERLSTLILLLCSFALGCWSPLPALFAFTVSIPILNELGHMDVADNAAPLGLVYSGIYLGVLLHQIGARLSVQRIVLSNEHSRAAPCSDGSGTPFITFASDIFTTAILLSLGIQIYQHSSQHTFWVAWCEKPTLDYSTCQPRRSRPRCDN